LHLNDPRVEFEHGSGERFWHGAGELKLERGAGDLALKPECWDAGKSERGNYFTKPPRKTTNRHFVVDNCRTGEILTPSGSRRLELICRLYPPKNHSAQ
jgi:hypothetical protein